VAYRILYTVSRAGFIFTLTNKHDYVQILSNISEQIFVHSNRAYKLPDLHLLSE